MCLALEARPATHHVDAFFEPAKRVREAAARVGARANVPATWLNDAVRISQSPRMVNTKVLREGDLDDIIDTPIIARDYTYPVPSLERDRILSVLHPLREAAVGHYGRCKLRIGTVCSYWRPTAATRDALSRSPSSIKELRGVPDL